MDPAIWPPHFRVLLLSLPDAETLRAWALRLEAGALVGMGEPDAVAAARRATADLENILFHPLDPEGIPWQDGHFDLVLDPAGAAPAGWEAEIRRVTRRA